MKSVVKPVLNLFSFLQVLFYMLLILTGSSIYLYLITKNLFVTIALSLFAMVFLFYHSVYLPKKLEREQFLLRELQKYATTMTFYMQSGYNVLQALNHSRKKLAKEIREDIEKTMVKLQDEAILDTSHFEKYNFASLNIFHQILNIKYEVGGEANALFKRVNESINFEIVKRDELFRKKRYMKRRVLTMMGMVASFPLIYLFLASELYERFLSMGLFAVGINAVLFISLLISLLFLQRTATDISIY